MSNPEIILEGLRNLPDNTMSKHSWLETNQSEVIHLSILMTCEQHWVIFYTATGLVCGIEPVTKARINVLSFY